MQTSSNTNPSALSRRRFLALAASTSAALLTGCYTEQPSNAVSLPNSETYQPRSIKHGAIFSRIEIETDPRFQSEYSIGVSENQSRFFLLTETQHWHLADGTKTREAYKFKRPGVIADVDGVWIPFFTAQFNFGNYDYILHECPEDIRMEAFRMQHQQKFMRAYRARHNAKQNIWLAKRDLWVKTKIQPSLDVVA